jgi:hypothetical protein
MDFELTDEPGFEFSLPSAWTPANATLTDPMGAVLTDPKMPAGCGVTSKHVWPNNAHDLARADEDHEVPDEGTDEGQPVETSKASPSSRADDGSTSLGTLTVAGTAGLSVLGPAGVGVRRLR